ncbi:hypothetical protein AB0I28_14700 [Phytomonospora sp. NPDC050363]|uniref:NACHT domain-containing protein n=1 Tax=Phytomonospora sp. NPDC050363 TaxID=3155642 RepID=UPI0033FA1201
MVVQGAGGVQNPSPGPWRTVGLGMVGLSPFALAGSVLTPVIREYPLWAVAVIVVTVWPVGFVMRVAGELVNRWVPRVADRVERVLGRHRKGYLARLQEHVRHLEVLGVATQGEFTLRLGDVYVEVGLSPKSAADSPTGSLGRQTLSEAIARSDSAVVAVIGGPGSGKTTLLRHEALSACLRKRAGIPILLEIRQHSAAIVADPAPTLATLAVSVDWQAGRTPAEWLEERLRDGGCLVLLDGLDEVAGEDDRRSVVRWRRGRRRPPRPFSTGSGSTGRCWRSRPTRCCSPWWPWCTGTGELCPGPGRGCTRRCARCCCTAGVTPRGCRGRGRN